MIAAVQRAAARINLITGSSRKSGSYTALVNAGKTALGFGPRARSKSLGRAEGSREYLHFSGLSVVDGAVPTNRAPLLFLCHPEMTNTLWLDEKVGCRPRLTASEF